MEPGTAGCTTGAGGGTELGATGWNVVTGAACNAGGGTDGATAWIGTIGAGCTTGAGGGTEPETGWNVATGATIGTGIPPAPAVGGCEGEFTGAGTDGEAPAGIDDSAAAG